jgi:multidrug resistance efflux pump
MDEGEFRQNELLNEEDPEQANLIVDKYQQSDEIKGVVPKLADDHERA